MLLEGKQSLSLNHMSGQFIKTVALEEKSLFVGDHIQYVCRAFYGIHPKVKMFFTFNNRISVLNQLRNTNLEMLVRLFKFSGDRYY